MPETDDRNALLHVTPVYLAGASSGEPALRPLLDAGFQQETDPKGNARLTSPGGRHHVDYMPHGLTHALWRISEAPDRYTPPTWQAVFTTGTPPEVVEAVTTALAQDTSPWPDGRRPRADDVLRPLADAGWRRRENQWEIDFTSPDHLATISYDTTPGHPLDPEYDPWLISGGRTLGHGYNWYGSFTTHAPPHLVTAAAGRLADPAPVSRTSAAALHPQATVSATRSAAPRAAAARIRTSTPVPSRQPSTALAPTPGQAATSRPRPRR